MEGGKGWHKTWKGQIYIETIHNLTANHTTRMKECFYSLTE